MNEKKSLLKSASLISLATVLSRIFGLARDIFTAKIFGTGWVSDAFVLAFMFPNLLRGLFGEGALNAAFVPVLSESLAKGEKQKAFHIASVVISVVSLLLGALVVLGFLSCSLMCSWQALGQKTLLTFALLRILWPYMLLICLAALMMGLLNSLKHFTVPALAPVLLNIVWIASLFWLCPLWGEDISDQIFGLAWGILLGGFLQFAIHWPVAIKLGFRFRFSLDVVHPSVRKICVLMLPVVLSYAVTQINILVDLLLAHFLGDGMQSSLWYAQRLIQFPLGVFGIALSVAILPSLSRFAALKQHDQFTELLIFALKVLLMIIVPCMVAFLVLNQQMVELFFMRGQFDALSVQKTSFALFCYSWGLWAFALVKMAVPSFYAMQDTKWPVKMAVIAMCCNIVLDLLLMGPLKQGGLALATAIAAMVNVCGLFYGLERKIGGFSWSALIRCCLQCLCAALIMWLVCHWSLIWINSWSLEGLWMALLKLFGPLGFGFFASWSFLVLVSPRECLRFCQMLRR